MKKLLIALVGTTLLAAPAFAQDPTPLEQAATEVSSFFSDITLFLVIPIGVAMLGMIVAKIAFNWGGGMLNRAGKSK